MKTPRVVLFTVNTGGYDSVVKIEPEPNLDYWYFTDNPTIIIPEFWNKSVLINPSGLSARRLSRLPKLRPHLFLPPHDISIYLDANLKLKRSIYEFALMCVKNSHLAVHPHPKRHCLYAEGAECLRANLDRPHIIKRQLNRYRRKGFPCDFGLSENRFIVRRNNQKVKTFNELWHREYYLGSQRDQLSFMFCVWRTGLKIQLISQHARRNRYYRLREHQLPRCFDYFE